MDDSGNYYFKLINDADRMPGMGSSRTVLDLQDSSRTKNRGLGLGLEALSSTTWLQSLLIGVPKWARCKNYLGPCLKYTVLTIFQIKSIDGIVELEYRFVSYSSASRDTNNYVPRG